MRPRWFVGVALVLAAVACGDDGATTTTVEMPGLTFDRSACPVPVEVGDAAGLLAVLEGLAWDQVGPYSSGSVPDSPDLVITGTITIAGDQVPIPASCLDREDCRHTAVFAGDRPGATIEGSDGWFEGEPSLTLADTTVRLGAALMDTHPGPYNFVPLITVLGPCGEPCNAGQFACQADLSCYGTFDAYCRRCEGRSAPECACRAPEGPLPDGTPCDYFVSGDVIESGTCRNGLCETAP